MPSIVVRYIVTPAFAKRSGASSVADSHHVVAQETLLVCQFLQQKAERVSRVEHAAECVNDFATPEVMNLLCRAVAFVG
jgi:hypothetical protein